MKSIYLGDGLAMNSILKEEARAQMTIIKGNILKNPIPLGLRYCISLEDSGKTSRDRGMTVKKN